MAICNALTVDVEDYYHVSAFEQTLDRASWGDFESRVVSNTHRLLDLFDAHAVKGTFFVLGWVAARFPQLVGEIDARGHEIGSHGYWHHLIYNQSRDEFREDVRRSKHLLENIAGKPVVAYRAPSFSITRKTWWALEVLAEEGYRIDSSIFPIHHDRYGIPDAHPEPHKIDTPAGELWEFPVAVRRIFGWNLPISGGGYFRLYPLGFTLRCLHHLNRNLARPFVFYIHPWELDVNQPRIHARSLLARARHYVNLATTERKLQGLLGQFQFGSLSRAIQSMETPESLERIS